MIKKPKADLSTMVIAPMPGMVKSVVAKVGDQARNLFNMYFACFLLLSTTLVLILQVR